MPQYFRVAFAGRSYAAMFSSFGETIRMPPSKGEIALCEIFACRNIFEFRRNSFGAPVGGRGAEVVVC